MHSASTILLSIVIPTKNEIRNIADCIGCMKRAAGEGAAEIVVVDNFSTDGTPAAAETAGARVVSAGPERSAQRNRGALGEARGEFVMFVDADMRVGCETLGEILDILKAPSPPDALYVREMIRGAGFWIRVRNFERSFYDATCIDGLRVIRRSLLRDIGGFDEKLFAGEDWDLDRRVLQRTGNLAITKNALIHDEGAFSLRRLLRKKSYYATNFSEYCRKWNYDATVRRQFGLRYRLWTVFVENGKWRRSFRRPHLLIAVWLYKIWVGLAVYLGMRRSRTNAS